MPNRHSLFWKLIGVLILFGLLMVSFHVDLGTRINEVTAYLSQSSRETLRQYGQEAEAAWKTGGAQGVDDFLQSLQANENTWAVVVDDHQRSLSSQPLTAEERERIDFVRQLEMPVGRPGGIPTYYVPFSDGASRLVLSLPDRLNPRKYRELWDLLLQRMLPAALALLVGILLYRLFISPLATLQRQANALSADDLTVRSGRLSRRQDELGDLARAFDHMAGRLGSTVQYQRRLLNDLSHELRTPLSRLRAAYEREDDLKTLQQRLAHEVEIMQRLVENSLELAWLDAERPKLERAPVNVTQLWEMLAEDACFEFGWSPERLRCELPTDCLVMANLSSLAQALENLLRNAIRHSPDGGVIRFTGHQEDGDWHFQLVDQGSGVPPEQLELIFEPFARLDSARPGDGGFGLGLSIARSSIALQGGRLWAELAREGGLSMRIRMPALEHPVGQFV